MQRAHLAILRHPNDALQLSVILLLNFVQEVAGDSNVASLLDEVASSDCQRAVHN